MLCVMAGTAIWIRLEAILAAAGEVALVAGRNVLEARTAFQASAQESTPTLLADFGTTWGVRRR